MAAALMSKVAATLLDAPHRVKQPQLPARLRSASRRVRSGPSETGHDGLEALFRRDPGPIRELVPEPSELALRVAPRVGLTAGDRLLEARSPRRWARRPGTPWARMTGSIGSRRAHPAPAPRRGRPAATMAAKRASIGAAVRPDLGSRNTLIRAAPGQRAGAALALERRERPPGCGNDFEGALNPQAIGGAQAPRRLGVAFEQDAVEFARVAAPRSRPGPPRAPRRGTAGMADRPSVRALK